jgi:hypothetical protein
MKLSEFIDNNVHDYPFWSLILGAVTMILLAIGHIIRHKQSSKNLHYYFVLCLICLSVQYICATQDISTAYLTAIADIIAFCLNTRLFLIWYISMEKHIVGRMEISLYVMVAIFKLCFWAIIF